MLAFKKYIKSNSVIGIFPKLLQLHLSKDVGQIPYYIRNHHDFKSIIVKYVAEKELDVFLKIIAQADLKDWVIFLVGGDKVKKQEFVNLHLKGNSNIKKSK